MKSVTINGREFLFVEVPEDATDFSIIGCISGQSTCMLYFDRHYGHDGLCEKVLPPGSYRILCKASEAGEEQAREIVEYRNNVSRGYVDYQKSSWLFTKATESLHSLILSLGMEVNRVIILEKVKNEITNL